MANHVCGRLEFPEGRQHDPGRIQALVEDWCVPSAAAAWKWGTSNLAVPGAGPDKARHTRQRKAGLPQLEIVAACTQIFVALY